MIIVNLPMPKNCLECPVRMECRRYREWMMDVADRDVPKPCESRCLIVGEQENKRC